MDDENVEVGEVIIMGSSASLSLNFTSVTTSHAGTYTCQTNLFDEILVVLESQFNITFRRNIYLMSSIGFCGYCVHYVTKVTD